MGSRLIDNVYGGRRSLGIAISFPAPELVELYGDAGWDLFYATMHSTRLDWDGLAHMARASYRSGITACARIPVQPWVGSYNPGIAVDAHRAFGIGVPVVIASVHGAHEAMELVQTAQYETRRSDDDQLAVPVIESQGAWNDLDAIVSIEGLRAAFLGVGDLARAFGVDGLEDPKLDAAVQAFLAETKSRGLTAMVNTGYASDPATAWDTTIQRIHHLYELGADVVFAEPVEVFLRSQTRRFLSDAKSS